MESPKPFMNSRNFTRVTTSHQIYVVDRLGNAHTGHIRDISMGGVFVTGIALGVDSAVSVAIVLSHDVRIDARGHVVRETAEGVGIALDVVEGSDSYEHLSRLVALNTRSDEQARRVVEEMQSKPVKIVPPAEG